MSQRLCLLIVILLIGLVSGCVSTPSVTHDGITIYYKDIMDYSVVFEIEDPNLMEFPGFPDLSRKPPFITLPNIRH